MGNCFLLTLGSHRPEGICPSPFGRSAGLAPRGDQGGHEHHPDADADQQADQELPHRADSLGSVARRTPPTCATSRVRRDKLLRQIIAGCIENKPRRCRLGATSGAGRCC